MRIGIPTEIKPNEGRVALTPQAAAELVKHGHEVYLETGAGIASGYPDADYQAASIRMVASAAELYDQAQMIVKVKEPIAAEYALLKSDHVLFSFLHLAANPTLARVLQEKQLTAVAFETIEENGRLPLLMPMSEIAGRLAVQIGATLLHSPQGGRGVMLGGLAGAERGRVVVLGAGAAGGQSVEVAAALGAEVIVFDLSWEKLTRMHALGPNITALAPNHAAITEAIRHADLVIGAVLVPGARAPKLVTKEMVRQMQTGSVIIDISVDQGGCIETIRPTDYTKPTYIQDGVIHFGVTNMPGVVPRTATQVLSSVLLPYVLRLASKDKASADPVMRTGINVASGQVVHPAVAAALA